VPVSQSAVSPGIGRRVLRGVVLLVFLILAWILIAHIPRTTTTFLLGALIAFAVEPPAKRLQRRMPKAAAIVLVYVVLALLVAVGFAIVLPVINDQIRALAANVPSYVLVVHQWQAGIGLWLQHEVPGLRLDSNASDAAGTHNDRITEIASASVASVGKFLRDAADAFFVVFSAIAVSIFFVVYDAQVADGFVSLFLESQRDTARKLSAEIAQTFGRYILGQATVSAITALVVAVFSAMIGFKLPWVLFLIIFVGYSIPMFGMVTAHLIAILLCVPQGPAMIVWVQAIMLITEQISDNVLVPKIMGRRVGVSPIGIMFAVFAGGELFGFVGLLLAIPLAALINILWRSFGARWLWQLESDIAGA
jgi:predicted PurR-regulated permease PerM